MNDANGVLPAAQPDLSDLFAGRGSLAARMQLGRAARKKVPRTRLAICELKKRDPIALLEASNVGRVPELIPIRYGRMVANPFAFYRGAAALMAFDLAALPRTDIIVQLCGDAHLANFGLFASPERRILFGPNDFDETLPGPFDWDVRRLAASFAIAARERGFAASDQRKLVRRLSETFRQRMAEFSKMDVLDLWYYQFSAASMLDIADSAGERKRAAVVVDKARLQSSRSVLDHAAVQVDGKYRIKENPPLVYHVPLATQRERRQYDDMIRVGSVGTRCYEALFMADGEWPLFLQLKEARTSVLENYLPRNQYANHGQRVVNGQRLLQSASDIFLGWSKMHHTGSDFYVRQLRDMKGAFDFASFDVEDLGAYAVSCGTALAHAMAKAGDPARMCGYLGKSDAFDAAIETFALAYAERNEADWSTLKAAVKAGRVAAIRE